MMLSRLGREFYTVVLTTDPPITTWEASFDGGTTWVTGEATGAADEYRWLVAGPDADPGTATVLPASSVDPRVRAVDDPEIIVRTGPRIHVVS